MARIISSISAVLAISCFEDHLSACGKQHVLVRSDNISLIRVMARPWQGSLGPFGRARPRAPVAESVRHAYRPQSSSESSFGASVGSLHNCLASASTSCSVFVSLPILVTPLSVGSMSTTRHSWSDDRTIHQSARAFREANRNKNTGDQDFMHRVAILFCIHLRNSSGNPSFRCLLDAVRDCL